MPWYDGWLDDGSEPLLDDPDRGRPPGVPRPTPVPAPDPATVLDAWCAWLQRAVEATDPEP